MTAHQPTPPETAPPRAWRRSVMLAVIMGCQLMMVLDTSIVTTALPHVERELGFTAASLSWVQNGYALAFGGLLLLGARTGDLLGRRRVFTAGVAVFAAASLLAGLAPTAELLIVGRVLQGVASAFAIPATLALLVQSFPQPEERTKAISIYSAVIGAGGSAGIIIGGVFTDLLSWRWGMLVNVPIGIAVLLLAPRFLPETPRRSGSVDIAGALTVTSGMSALVFGLVTAGEAGWGDIRVCASLAGAGVLLVLFVLVERRAAHPVTPLSLFADVTRSGAYALRVLTVGAMFSTFYFLSQYLQNVLGFDAFVAGLSYVPLTLMFFAMVYVVRPLRARIGAGPLLVVALVVATIGMLWLSGIGADSRFLIDILPALLVLGAGQGIAIILLTEFGMAGVPAEDSGAASGLVNTAHQLGGTVGLALLTVVFAAAGHQGDPVLADALPYAAVFRAAVWFYVVAVVIAVTMVAHARRRAHADRIGSGPRRRG